MNLTVADRERMAGRLGGASSGEASAEAPLFLNSALSFYGVGSKNACFYLGRAVTVVTHEAGAPYVHELRVAGDELAERWEAERSAGGAACAYTSDMRHRELGDARSLLAEAESRHARPLAAWRDAEGRPNEDTAAEGRDAAHSFTRLVMNDLARPVFDLLTAEGGMEGLARELAHVYHYYVFSERGNRGGDAPPAPHASRPNITLEEWRGGACVFSRALLEVQDDMETRLLRASAREFTFALRLPVAVLLPPVGPPPRPEDCVAYGVLRYYPCAGDSESIPLDDAAAARAKAARRAARNSGGKVIVQVKERMPKGTLKAREVRIPSAWVDAIVVDTQQSTSYDIPFDPAFSGELTGAERAASEALDHAREVAASQEAFSERQAVARRAYQELFNTDKTRPVINYGVGVPDAVAKLIAARNEQHRI